MSVVFTVALTLLVSYLLGCFNGSVMTSHFIIRDDVRQHGSGNAGYERGRHVWNIWRLTSVLPADATF